MTMQVLLVEDHNLSQTESLVSGLEEQGYLVEVAHTPEVAATKLQTLWPNCIVFNQTRGLPFSDFKKDIVKVNLNVPHVFVGSEDEPSQATDSNIVQVTVSSLDLCQGIEKAMANQANRFLRFPRLVIDCQQHQILRGSKRFALTPKEFKLLYLLIENQDQVLSRKTIMQKVWETDYLGDTRTLDVHIRWLREKIEEEPSRPRRLITVRGVGYRFMAIPE